MDAVNGMLFQRLRPRPVDTTNFVLRFLLYAPGSFYALFKAASMHAPRHDGLDSRLKDAA